jgi:hypothetical protein
MTADQETVWVAMIGIDRGDANLAAFGDTKGLYVWVAGRGRTEDDFCRLIETETSGRGLSVKEIADVTLADVALKERAGADVDWEALISAAHSSPSLAFDSTYYFYEGP